MPMPELTAAFNKQFGTAKKKSMIKAFIDNHQIRSGRTGRFEKGHVPWDNGTKGLIKPNSGSFQKGHIPANLNPLGHERIDSKDGYVLIKIKEKDPYFGRDTRYKHKHVHIWETINGPVPEGHVVIFKDGDKYNFAPDNLVLVTRTELLHLNLHDYKVMPAELKPSVMLLAKLEAKAGVRNKSSWDVRRQKSRSDPRRSSCDE